MADLDRMLAARSVAVVGASARPGSFGERLAIEALRSRVPGGLGRVHLVNPAYDQVQGEPCLPSLAALDDPVDLVLLGVPDATVPDHVALAAAHGAGGAVVYGSAVGQGPAIRVAAAGMPVCGAGCMGFVNVSRGLRALGYLERSRLERGGIALITHSGSVFSALLRTHRRLEYSLAVSSGQELVTTTGDYLGWALSQPETRVVGLFLETIRDAPTLRASLARAAESDVPVVALTVGGSPTGRAMVTAHSGAVAGADAAWEALFATYGVHRARDMEELVDTLELFAVGRRIRTRASGIATVHDSGAERVLLADVAADEHVPFAGLGEGTRARLSALLDDGLEVTNPLDVWGRGADTEELFTSCLNALAEDSAVDVVALAIDLVEEFDGDESYPRAVERAAAASDKPVVVLSHVPAAVDPVQASALRSAGIPVLEGARSGLRAIRHLRDHADPPVPCPETPSSASTRRLPGWLGAVDSLALLEEFGVPTVPTLAAGSAEAAVEAAALVGYPVVVKTDQPGVEHRARVGGVHLGLPDEAAVRTAYAALAATLGPRVVVQPHRGGRGEVALGILHDPALGPILILAAGGSRIEELSQRVLVLPPLDQPGSERVVARFAALGARGPDLTGVAPALMAVSRLAVELGDGLMALDVNPLLITDSGPVAVDALVQASSA